MNSSWKAPETNSSGPATSQSQHSHGAPSSNTKTACVVFVVARVVLGQVSPLSVIIPLTLPTSLRIILGLENRTIFTGPNFMMT